MEEKPKIKKPVVIIFSHILIQLCIIVFFTVIWLNSPILFGVDLNIGYVLFMFIAIIIASIIVLYTKANPEIPIPKKPIQQFSNLIKAMIDIITDKVLQEQPGFDPLKSIIQKAAIWHIRDAEINDEINIEVIKELKDYINEKLYPKEKIDGEE